MCHMRRTKRAPVCICTRYVGVRLAAQGVHPECELITRIYRFKMCVLKRDRPEATKLLEYTVRPTTACAHTDTCTRTRAHVH